MTRGATWQAPTVVIGGWARRLDKPTQVLAPKEPAADALRRRRRPRPLAHLGGRRPSRCAPTARSSLTRDGGSTWSDSGDAPGAVALSNLLVDNSLTTYAVRLVGACKGVQLVEVVKGRAAAVVACVPVARRPARDVGLSVTEPAGWIVAGNQTWLSQGDLTSWKRA